MHKIYLLGNAKLQSGIDFLDAHMIESTKKPVEKKLGLAFFVALERTGLGGELGELRIDSLRAEGQADNLTGSGEW